MKLSELQFVDLYLGDDFADFKGLKGVSERSTPAPPELNDCLDDLRRRCRMQVAMEKDPEFSLVIDDIMYRCTMVIDVSGQKVFILRRSTAEVRALNKVGIAPVYIKQLLAPHLDGLVIIAGQTGAGKTSTAVAIIKERLVQHGGISVTIEDPPEVNLNGSVGKGRCMQIRASRRTGGYKEHLVRTLRANPDQIFLGEVREEAAASQVVEASMNGHLIVSTIHAGSVIAAIDRLASLASNGGPEGAAFKKLALGLRMVIWQNLEPSPGGGPPRYVYEALSLIGNSMHGATSKIASGNTRGLTQEIDQQARKIAMNPMGR